MLPLPDVRRSRIIRSIGKPKGDVPALQAPRNLDAVFGMPQSAFANRFLGICEGSVLVFLILKQVGIYGAGGDAIAAGESLDLFGALCAVRTVPQDMQCDSRAHTGEQMYLTCVTELLLRSGCRRRLNEFSKTSARIRKAPRWKLNAECLQCGKNLVHYG